MTQPLPEPEAREALVHAMRRMHASGLNRGTSGNASIRVDGGMMVTPSGIAPDALTPDMMVFVSETGAPATDGLRPSTEYRMHHHILRARPDAQSVMHCHSRHATILACCNKPIEPIHYMVLVAGAPRIEIAPFAPFGTESLARHAVTTMAGANACLLAHHGQVAVGASWQQALAIAEEVEEQAAITYGALLLGGATTLTEIQLAQTIQQFRGYGQG
jgi:L-fuculose-phosphate aldolase